MVKQDATFDSSFWINAHRAGLLAEVLDEYRLYFSPAVAAELRPSFPSGEAFWQLVRAGTVAEVVAVAEPFQEFGPGERAAINLALQHRDWTLLIDDQRPLRAAVELGLPAVCTPVLVVALFLQGTIDAAQCLQALARLAALQTVSPALLTAALAQLGQALAGKGRG